jgi:hypothetical protein
LVCGAMHHLEFRPIATRPTCCLKPSRSGSAPAARGASKGRWERRRGRPEKGKPKKKKGRKRNGKMTGG